MCVCTLCADRFLQGVYRSALFRAYCRDRGIALARPLPRRPWDETIRWWVETVNGLPKECRAQVEWEQLAVSELGTQEGSNHLLEAADGSGLPPAGVPRGAPLALWFLLHDPVLFREVYRHHDDRPSDVWYAVRAPRGLPLPDPRRVEEPLAARLGAFFRESTGACTCCAVAAHRIPEAMYFCVRVAGRTTAVETFTPAGATAFRHVPQPMNADFVYYPRDGTFLLRSPLRSCDRVRDLLDCLGQTALDAPLRSERPGFALDVLKRSFRPLPDADDVESVRVKTLHLRYPGRAARRELRLETLTSDSSLAVEELLHAHADGALDELRVTHAVLQIRLHLEGCSKTHLVRLWPDRCDAGQGPFRTRVLASLRSWGL